MVGKLCHMLTTLIKTLVLGTIPASGSSPSPMGDPMGVRMVSESVTFEIGQEDVLVTGTYVFKNTTSKPVLVPAGVSMVPVSEEVKKEALNLGDMVVTWDKKPIPTARLNVAGGSPCYKFSLNCVASGTHALRISYRAGLVRKDRERTLLFMTGGSSGWVGTVDVANYSFKYSLKTVFAIKSFEPDYKWQWGETGAFARRANFKAEPNEMIRLNYWPGDF